MRVFALSLALAFFLSTLFLLPVTLPTTTGQFSFISEAQAKKTKTVSVKSYKKKNGTKVRKHKRSK